MTGFGLGMVLASTIMSMTIYTCNDCNSTSVHQETPSELIHRLTKD